MELKEEFLSFIWRFRLFMGSPLYCSSGELLRVLDTGLPNQHAGPDFFNAKIKIGNTIWNGNIEIHVKSSDWMLHGHAQDRAYDSVILHVVHEDDLPVKRADGSILPSFIMANTYSAVLLERYSSLISSLSIFPCQNHIFQIDPILINISLSRVLIERYEQKYQEVMTIQQRNKGNWSATYFFLLARSFGFKVNNLPFEMLANSLDQQLFAKYKDSPLQIEALVFGQAGFLSGKFDEAYPRQLQTEYTFLQKKYNLKPLDVSLWKFLRMRPASFPTVRLAQFAALMIKSQHLFSSILSCTDLRSIKGLFENLPVHSYWRNHYHFRTRSLTTDVQLGNLSVENIIINTVCVILFSYGKEMGQQTYLNRALIFLEQLQAEKNGVIRYFKEAGIKIENAFHSQALLELNKSYCSKKKCLNCGIGIKILNK